jgi:hypothetical protein
LGFLAEDAGTKEEDYFCRSEEQAHLEEDWIIFAEDLTPSIRYVVLMFI